jgi:hypothetical protein
VNTDRSDVFPQAPSPIITNFLNEIRYHSERKSFWMKDFSTIYLRIPSLDKLGCPALAIGLSYLSRKKSGNGFQIFTLADFPHQQINYESETTND